MSDEMKYYHNLNEVRNGKTRPNDPLNSYYDLDQEEYDEYEGASLFQGCVVALVMTAAIVTAVWYAIEVIFD